MKKLITFLLCVAVLFAAATVIYSNINDLESEPVSEETVDASILEGFEEKLSSNTYYYYNSLSEAQQDAYRKIYGTVMSFGKSCNVSVTAEELQKIYTAILYDNPDIFWVKANYGYVNYENSVQISLIYRNTKEEAEALTEQLDTKINEIIAMADFDSDYEKELFLHDYICENTVYDESTLITVGSTAYGLLLDGRGICEGYARAMQILLDRVGIKNYLITGYATSDGKGGKHMWNVVTIDGKNYHLDATWDDGDSYEEVSHLYFNLPDSDISVDHSCFSPQDNNCIWYDANYYVVNGMYLTSFSDFNALTDICADMVSEGKLYAEFRFESKGDYNHALSIIENDNRFFDFVTNVAAKSNKGIATDKIEYFNFDDFNYLCIVFKG